MNISNEIVAWIFEWIYELMPFFRAAWIATILMGIVLLVIAIILKQNPDRRKSPWIVGGIGLAMFISSGTQLFYSFII